MRVSAALLVACLVTAAGCKKSRSYDRSSPEATLRSFFAALEKGAIPKDVGLFVADEVEISSWRMRCKKRGCERAKVGAVQVADHGPMSATLLVDYEVYGRNGGRVMGGEDSPIRFRREGEVWRIVQFGRRIRIEPEMPAAVSDGGPAAGDAGATATGAADAGASADAGATADAGSGGAAAP